MKIEQFLIDNRRFLNLSEIEAACNLSNGTINHFIKGKRKLTDSTINKLSEFFSNRFDVAPIKQEVIKEDIKPAKQSKVDACVNINDYKLLLSGKYQNIKTGEKVCLNKTEKGYFLA